MAPPVTNYSYLAARALLDLMAHLFCYEQELPINVNKHLRYHLPLNPKEDTWNRSFLVDKGFEGLPLQSALLFRDWVLEVFHCPVVRWRVQLKLERLQQEIAYKEEWARDFDREREAQEWLNDDAFTPVGDVHYRYIYRYDPGMGIFRKTRHRVTGLEGEEYWTVDHPYWFDYFGPEEDERGLIAFVDY